jgi:hypothetical protein
MKYVGLRVEYFAWIFSGSASRSRNSTLALSDMVVWLRNAALTIAQPNSRITAHNFYISELELEIPKPSGAPRLYNMIDKHSISIVGAIEWQ